MKASISRRSVILQKNIVFLAFSLSFLMCSCGKQAAIDTKVLPPVVPPAYIPEPTIYPGYILAWNDEFNGTTVDLSKWNLETGTGVDGNFGTGQLDRATERSQKVKIVNGIVNSGGGSLAVTTQRETMSTETRPVAG